MKEISITPRVANFQGFMNSHLVRSYISACKTLIVNHKVKQSTNKKQTRECSSSLLRAADVFFFSSLPKVL